MNIITKTHPILKIAEFRHPPITIRVNEFNEKSTLEFCKQMSEAQETGQPVIPVVIDSYGGHCYSLLAMVDAIKASTVPIATIVEGKAMSCGAFLLSFGTPGYRYVGEHATVMIHEVSAGDWGKVEEIKVTVEEAVRLNNKLFGLLDQNCGKVPGYFHQLVHNKNHADWFLDADATLAQGLADHKKIPTMNVTVGVTFDFR